MFQADRFKEALVAPYASPKTVLHEAIAYALAGPGKLLRPQLVYACALACDLKPDVALERAMPSMLAVEMVHCYSLVHDDLPAMDDDDYRRGRLSCHKKYGEAVAILVGDALVADAFERLLTSPVNPLLQIKELSAAISSKGMALGQHLDLIATAKSSDFSEWAHIHALKTGRLFEAACVLGGLCADASSEQIEALRGFARAYGLAFQLRDDLKDGDASVVFLGQSRVESLLKETADQAMQLCHKLASSELSALTCELL